MQIVNEVIALVTLGFIIGLLSSGVVDYFVNNNAHTTKFYKEESLFYKRLLEWERGRERRPNDK